MRKIIILGMLIALFLILIGCGNNATGGTIADSEGVITIPLSDITSTVEFFTYTDNGVGINYFAVRGSDGEVRTAFDACDVCGGYKGYQQKGTDIECRNCGKVFSIDGLGTQNKGYGCWPSYLPHTIQGDNIVIGVSDIRKSRRRFA